jgi:epoxyqueuosine reductase
MLDAAAVKARARELGFDVCGIAPAENFPELRFLREWLARGHAGHMGYLPRSAARRQDIRRVLPTARSVIITGTLYNTSKPYSVERTDPGEALISRYAWGDDYHDVLGARLERLLEWMRAEHGGSFEARAYVDTGPVQERVYAQYAGLGWIGKNTCLINPSLGSWLFLAEIVCSLPLEADAPAFDQCGTCTLCLDACPTGALVEPHVLDATRCISYLTIEIKKDMPVEMRDAVGTHVYGCDICQDVCPYNVNAPTTSAAEWQPRPGLDGPKLVDLWRRPDADLEALVAGTPMPRPGLPGLRRNIAVAMGNSADRAARSALDEPPAGDAPAFDSSRRPMVRRHVEWAREKGSKIEISSAAGPERRHPERGST